MTQPEGRPTVTLPVFGTVQRRWVIVAAATVAAIVGYAYWSRSRGGPGGGVLYDPATGSVTGPGGYVNPAPHSPDSGEPVVVDDTVIRTADQWGAAAVAALTQAGWDAQFAATAIGKYLGGDRLAPTEVAAVRAAQALVGLCPGNPPIIPDPSSTGQQPPPPDDEPDPDPLQTHTQVAAGDSVTTFLTRYFGGDEAEWRRINADTPTTANTTWTASGPVFKQAMTYRLPGYVTGGNTLPY